jgi:hypothetical protein
MARAERLVVDHYNPQGFGVQDGGMLGWEKAGPCQNHA